MKEQDMRTWCKYRAKFCSFFFDDSESFPWSCISSLFCILQLLFSLFHLVIPSGVFWFSLLHPFWPLFWLFSPVSTIPFSLLHHCNSFLLSIGSQSSFLFSTWTLLYSGSMEEGTIVRERKREKWAESGRWLKERKKSLSLSFLPSDDICLIHLYSTPFSPSICLSLIYDPSLCYH